MMTAEETARHRAYVEKPCACGDCVKCLSPLPAGGTCASACAHVYRCRMLFGQVGDEPFCQFVPSRFTPRAPDAIREGR
jgi:hypothetical protein